MKKGFHCGSQANQNNTDYGITVHFGEFKENSSFCD